GLDGPEVSPGLPSHSPDGGLQSPEGSFCTCRGGGVNLEPTRPPPRRTPASREDTMQPKQDRPTVSIAPNNPVFDLPVIVGIERGLFAKAGLDVSFSATYADREKDSVQTPLMSRLKENLFDCGSAD